MSEYSTNFFGASIDNSEITDGAVTGAKIAANTITISNLAASASNALANPIGTIAPWLKTFTNTPALPTGWVECNGAVLSDAASVYDGQAIPNLNGQHYFLRGSSTSGTTGGSETHNHTIGASGFAHGTGSNTPTDNASSTGSTSTLPSYYEVVWIMRVK